MRDIHENSGLSLRGGETPVVLSLNFSFFLTCRTVTLHLDERKKVRIGITDICMFDYRNDQLAELGIVWFRKKILY